MTDTLLIYIPGLGDGYDSFRRHALKHWQKNGLHVELYPMKWRDGTKTLAEKLQPLEDRIASTHQRLVIVGESAGGSVVMDLLARHEDKIYCAITICGKNVRADRVSPRLYISNPAFKESMTRADSAVKGFDQAALAKLHIFYSEADPTVRPIDSIIGGATVHSLPTAGHLVSIAAALTIYKNRVIAVAASNT